MADNANTTDISNKLVNVAGLEHFWNKTKEDSYVTAAALTDLNDRLERYKNDIDFTPIENKIDEGIGTLSEKIDNIDLSSVENKVQEESAAIQAKIDNIKLPEIDTSALAKQGENQDATNSAIYALLSQFGESVLQEAVTVICNCAEDIAWEEYGVVITYADGTLQSLPMSENGTCSFSVKIGQEYSVQLPVIGAYIAPTKKTYTASTSSRQIYWSYVVSGIFGLDELGRRYTIEQIEALEDKSIIKYGGYTDETLENSPRDDGTTGNGFMWDLYQETINVMWSSPMVEFNTDLLPYVDQSASLKLYNGAAYTRYIISEGKRLSVSTPAATACANRTIDINHETKSGFLLSGGQIYRLIVNYSKFSLLYNTLGITVPTLKSGRWWTSNQRSAIHATSPVNGNMNYGNKDYTGYILVAFDLPK